MVHSCLHTFRIDGHIRIGHTAKPAMPGSETLRDTKRETRYLQAIGNAFQAIPRPFSRKIQYISRFIRRNWFAHYLSWRDFAELGGNLGTRSNLRGNVIRFREARENLPRRKTTPDIGELGSARA